MIIVANFGMVSNGECHKIQHIHLFLEKLWRRFGNSKIFCCCLVLNRKTSNVNMEPKNGKILDDIGWLLMPNCTLLFLDTPFLLGDDGKFNGKLARQYQQHGGV